MDGNELISRLKRVRDSAVEATICNLQSPPGRRPYRSLVELSQWYNSQDEEGRKRIADVARYTAHSALFGIAAVLDGVRAFDDDPESRLELVLVRGEKREVLNDPDHQQLIDFVGANDLTK
jgi:hypothetical protein